MTTTPLRTRLLGSSMTAVASAVLGIASAILLARFLGGAGRGEYSWLATIAAFGAYWSTLGLGQSLLYSFGRRDQTPGEILGYSAVYTLSSAVLGGLIVTALFAGTEPLEGSHGPSLQLSLALAWMASQHLYGFAAYVTLGGQDLGRYNRSVIGKNCASLALLFVLVGIFNFGVIGAVAADISCFLAAGAYLWSAHITEHGAPRVTFEPAKLRAHLAYGLPVFLHSAIMLLHNRVDVLILQTSVSTAALGAYAVAFGLAERLLIVPNAIATVMYPHAVAENSAGRSSATPQLLRLLALGIFAVSCAVILIIPWAIPILFGPQFEPAVDPARLLVIGTAFLGIYGLIESELKGRGRPLTLGFIGLSGAAVNIAANLAFIPAYGIVGAAWASVISYGTLLCAGTAAYLHISATPVRKLFMFTAEDLRVLRSASASPFRRRPAARAAPPKG